MISQNHSYTGIANDDRRIQQELQAMGAFDAAQDDQPSLLLDMLRSTSQFLTWLRWKGEVGVYGCRVGADFARRQEGLTCA
ncbi:hypothetical protein [Marinobacterium jannaschii]|uniref:hypothetical protein n=1 Tax=Marinobacterium jannaschii TaxID=64970 RepID=UPI00055CF228|nr:hypothetical protein [Marinobacterium jannaschii]